MPVSSAWHLRRAAQILRAGGVVAYPTEGVYGLGCDPLNEHAIMRLLAIKRRALDKGLIVIAARLDQLTPLLLLEPTEIPRSVLESWPGPVTWLLPAAPAAPVWLTGGSERIAVRVTAHPLAASLCLEFGAALVSTSANRSGRAPARSSLQARRMLLGADIDYFLNGRTGGASLPTEIRNASDGRVLRAG